MFSLTAFSQTQALMDELESISVDSTAQIASVKELIKKSIEFEFDSNIAYDNYVNVAIVFYSKNMLDYTAEFFALALIEAQEMSDIEKEAEILSNLGVVNELRGDYVKALNNYQLSLESFIKSGNLRSQSIVYNNIAIVHQELDNVDLAIQNLNKSYDLKTQLNDTALIASALNNYGVFYEECAYNLDSALFYYTEAKDIYSSINDSFNEAICASNVAQVFHSSGDNYNARINFEFAISKFRDLEKKLWVSKALMYLASLEMSDSNFEKAVDLLEESKSLLDQNEHTRTVLEISEILSEAYLENSQFEKSAYEYKYFESLKDSLLSIEKQNEISRLEIKFQTTQKQYEIDTLKIEKEVQQQRINLIVWFVVALVIFLISLIVFLYMRGKHRKLEKKNKNMQLKQQLLQNQMNPHFLFNVLTSIQSYITASESEKAANYLAKFSKLTRMVLQSSASETILLEEELTLLTSYLHLEKLRHNESFSFEVSIENGLEVEEIEIPPMMIQPFLENAVVHGASKVSNGLIRLEVKQINESIEFKIIDNGPGFTEKTRKSSEYKSMAMSILQERKDILKQKWQKPVEIKRNNLKMGTEIVVVLPII